MIRRYTFTTLASAELESAKAWYDSQRGGLGDELLLEVADSVEKVLEAPERWPRASTRSRQYRLNRFPYRLIYQIREDRIVIICFMHLSREPDYWRSRDL